MLPYHVQQGDSPLVLCQPHGGTFLPVDVEAKLNENGKLLADTDWHIARLYDGLVPDVTVVAASFHRYVIDANRDPLGHSLYPGQNTTSLVPLTDFDDLAIWSELPKEQDVQQRIDDYHRLYHAAIEVEIARVKALYGFAIIYDCHSIRSRIPFLFEGTLPDLNIGTNNGETCATSIEKTALGIAQNSEFSTVLNGRFRGGWTTRHYGKPSQNIHAIQMEIAQSAYLETESAPFAYSETKATKLRPVLSSILTALAEIRL